MQNLVSFLSVQADARLQPGGILRGDSNAALGGWTSCSRAPSNIRVYNSILEGTEGSLLPAVATDMEYE